MMADFRIIILSGPAIILNTRTMARDDEGGKSLVFHLWAGGKIHHPRFILFLGVGFLTILAEIEWHHHPIIIPGRWLFFVDF